MVIRTALNSSHFTACYGVRCQGIGEQCSNGECVCKDEENCGNLYDPVCGSNRGLYQSKCHADAAICKAPPEEKFKVSERTCEGMYTLLSYNIQNILISVVIASTFLTVILQRNIVNMIFKVMFFFCHQSGTSVEMSALVRGRFVKSSLESLLAACANRVSTVHQMNSHRFVPQMV